MAIHISFILLLICLWSCGSDNTKKDNKTTPSEESTFKIEKNTDSKASALPKKVTVFGIPIYGVAQAEDKKMLHAANIMAQYLDNDEDGKVDNATVVETLVKAKAFLFIWKSKSQDINAIKALGKAEFKASQDLGNDETYPEWHTGGGTFDAALEEVLHLITHEGYSKVYPKALGESAGTELTNAMDKARGGHFVKVPESYPDGAWYTYDDETCNYECMATEYFYWGLTSILGGQSKEDTSEEWKLNTREKVKNQDPDIYKLLTDAQYKLPTALPNGSYRQ